MFSWIKARLSFPWRAVWRPRRRAFMLLWVALGTWDLLAAQLLPPEWANKWPRVYDALAAMSGWLPWWAWTLIGLGIILAVSREYGVRQKYKANLDEWRQVDPLEIWRAGCLWKGHKPHYPIPFLDPAYPSFIRLMNAAKAGQLVVENPNSTIDARSLVTRGELVQFARSKGEMPEFLEGAVSEDAVSSTIKMSVGESGPYFKTDGSVYDIRRTYNIKLENTAQSKSLSDCSIHIIEVAPPTDYEGPWLLQDGIMLAAGAHTFIPLVTYREPREPGKYGTGDTFATMGTATGHPTLDVGPQYTLKLRATAQDTAFCDFECRVWVDENHRLRIQEV